MDSHLFSDLPDPTEPEDIPGGWALWFRPFPQPGIRRKWRKVATGKTQQEILSDPTHAGSGEFYPLPCGQKPSPDKQLGTS
jgi:hypothetical protein